MSDQTQPSAPGSTADRKPAVVLVSGGLDSATTLAIAKDQGFDCHAISFDYGQRHRFELKAASEVCDAFGVRQHLVYPLLTDVFSGSALTDTIDVPHDRSEAEMTAAIPVTYVPARNTVFLSIALAWAETLSAFDLFVGVNAVDYSGYPDCRPEFVASWEVMANLATKVGVEHAESGRGNRIQLHAPLIQMTKSEIIQTGTDLGVDYGLTHSCYDPDASGKACGKCDSCVLRRKGFEDAGLSDPTRYA